MMTLKIVGWSVEVLILGFVYASVALGQFAWSGALIITGVVALGCSLALLPLTRSVSLTNSVLRIPAVIGTQRIAVSDIAGIGMLYGGLLDMRGWQGYVWDVHGKRYVLRSVSTRARRFVPYDAMNYAAVSHTKAGQCMKNMYARVASLQGPHGALATMELQKLDNRRRVRRSDRGNSVVAFWSPNGSMGPFERHGPSWRKPPQRPLHRLGTPARHAGKNASEETGKFRAVNPQGKRRP